MEKIKGWLWSNRSKIGYTIGALNLLSGISYAVNGDYGLAVLWLVIGSFIIYDVKTYK
jgi:hypothetical protein